jgi:hypothetical protein
MWVAVLLVLFSIAYVFVVKFVFALEATHAPIAHPWMLVDDAPLAHLHRQQQHPRLL